MGIEIATVLYKKYGKNFEVGKTVQLLGNAETVQELQDGVPAATIVAGWSRDLAAFELIRKKYLLYP
jgi:hypothetical protein